MSDQPVRPDPRGLFKARKQESESDRQQGGAAAMLITCTDSLLDEHLLPRLRDESDDSRKLLVWRNTGHVVPPYGAGHADAEVAIDNAVHQFGVQEIIMCGHLSCDALQTLMHGRHQAHAPHAGCMQFARAAQRIVEEKYGRLPRAQLLQAMVEENVFVQMANLRTYPTVLAGLARGTLKLHSWIYDHDRDEIYGHEPRESAFLQRLRGQRQPRRRLLPYIDPCEIYLA